MEKEIKYSIRSRLWICTEDGAFLGEGRVALLKQIDEFGSISKAAKAMKMSYKKAWELVNSMNEQSKLPLVERTVGGSGGGGTVVTEAGKNAIEVFNQVNKRCRAALDKEVDLMKKLE